MNLPQGLPEPIYRQATHARCTEIPTGKSSARVLRLDDPDAGISYLKLDALRHDLPLRAEADRLAWTGKHMQVPQVLCYASDGEREYLWLTEVPGLPASDARFADRIPELIRLLAAGIRDLHRVDIAYCPFDERLDAKIEMARVRTRLGLVDENDFEESRRGRSAADLFEELLTLRPVTEDAVFTHGDYCLPNIIVDPELRQINGFIDMGRAGIADRYQDITLARRSLEYNFGEGWSDTLFSECGVSRPDSSRVTFYELLDEFF